MCEKVTSTLTIQNGAQELNKTLTDEEVTLEQPILRSIVGSKIQM